MTDAAATGWGLIAGNGRFPFLVLEGARSQGIDMAVIALREEASPELEQVREAAALGEPRRTEQRHRTAAQEGVTHAVMAGQVKHNKIFSAIRPDWKLAKLLLLAAAEKHGFADRRGSRCSKTRAFSWWIRRCFCSRCCPSRRADAPRARRARSRGHRLRAGASRGRSRAWTSARRW